MTELVRVRRGTQSMLCDSETQTPLTGHSAEELKLAIYTGRAESKLEDFFSLFSTMWFH